MSSLSLMPLKKSLPIITQYFHSFAIKSFMLKKDKKWINVFSHIQLSNKESKELFTEYSRVEAQIGKIDLENIKIVFRAEDICHFEKCMHDIQQGSLTVGDYKLQFRGEIKDFQSITFRISRYMKHGELSEYEIYLSELDNAIQPKQYLQENGISSSIFGLSDLNDLALSWFGNQRFDQLGSLVLIAPLYAKINSVQYVAPSTIEVNVKIHEKLTDRTVLWIIKKTGTNYQVITYRECYKTTSAPSTLQEDFTYITFDYKFEGINTTDQIEIKLNHELLGNLSSEKYPISWLLTEITDPFRKSFELFESSDKLLVNISKPKKSDDFEIAVSWLLQLFGFKTVHLTSLGEKLKSKVVRGSADILAYYSKDTKLFCIDCTVTSPPHDKIDKIKHTADFISEQIKLPVRPIIFSAINCEIAKEQGKQIDVLILDQQDIGRLLQIYQLGQHHLQKIHQILY